MPRWIGGGLLKMQSLLYIPTQSVDPIGYTVVGDATFTRPLGHCLRSAVDRKESAVSSIGRLFAKCRPLHIGRFVRAIVVDALDGMRWRGSESDVGQERFKRIRPSGAHVDTTSAVVGVRTVVAVAASLLHSRPYDVLGASGHVRARISVPNRAWMIARVAATRLRRATAYVVGAHKPFCAASASARIEQSAIDALNWAGDGPTINGCSDSKIRCRARSSHTPNYTLTMKGAN